MNGEAGNIGWKNTEVNTMLQRAAYASLGSNSALSKVFWASSWVTSLAFPSLILLSRELLLKLLNNAPRLRNFIMGPKDDKATNTNHASVSKAPVVTK